MTKQLRSVGPVSCAKVFAVIYGVLGLLMGVIFSLFAFIGAAAGTFEQVGGGLMMGMIFGVGALILMPLFYAAIGGIGGLILAALYNVVANVTGGIEMEIE